MTHKQIESSINKVVTDSKQYTQADFQNAISANPDVTSEGIQHPNDPDYVKNRIWLSKAFEEFQLACGYLNNCKITSTIRDSGSYGIKHTIEKMMDVYYQKMMTHLNPNPTHIYIGNGSVILAARFLNLKMKIAGPNAYFAISARRLFDNQELESYLKYLPPVPPLPNSEIYRDLCQE